MAAGGAVETVTYVSKHNAALLEYLGLVVVVDVEP